MIWRDTSGEKHCRRPGRLPLDVTAAQAAVYDTLKPECVLRSSDSLKLARMATFVAMTFVDIGAAVLLEGRP